MIALEDLKRAKKIKVIDNNLDEDNQIIMKRQADGKWVTLIEGEDLHEPGDPLSDEDIYESLDDEMYNITLEILN